MTVFNPASDIDALYAKCEIVFYFFAFQCPNHVLLPRLLKNAVIGPALTAYAAEDHGVAVSAVTYDQITETLESEDSGYSAILYGDYLHMPQFAYENAFIAEFADEIIPFAKANSTHYADFVIDKYSNQAFDGEISKARMTRCIKKALLLIA